MGRNKINRESITNALKEGINHSPTNLSNAFDRASDILQSNGIKASSGTVSNIYHKELKHETCFFMLVTDKIEVVNTKNTPLEN